MSHWDEPHREGPDHNGDSESDARIDEGLSRLTSWFVSIVCCELVSFEMSFDVFTCALVSTGARIMTGSLRSAVCCVCLVVPTLEYRWMTFGWQSSQQRLSKVSKEMDSHSSPQPLLLASSP